MDWDCLTLPADLFLLADLLLLLLVDLLLADLLLPDRLLLLPDRLLLLPEVDFLIFDTCFKSFFNEETELGIYL